MSKATRISVQEGLKPLDALMDPEEDLLLAPWPATAATMETSIWARSSYR